MSSTARESFASAGEAPHWCREWFSPYAVFARVASTQVESAWRVLTDFASVFAGLALESKADASSIAQTVEVQRRYVRDHLQDDRGRGVLAKLMDRAWAERFLEEVLFPSESIQ